ncbi:putative Cystatin domain-containing protein [Rosa chinensis]|uniref:Cysteine proteinase inhibitor n=1 Tax=Rosa chinensis TaxID=74649 RepID=A0A2P6SAR1_ROSCH|nr:cysteine proteinase inhibitor 12 [Rosa chinensis]PRQ55767.1 putative Cystatin domain-containing protein [Rosa chinensis]
MKSKPQSNSSSSSFFSLVLFSLFSFIALSSSSTMATLGGIRDSPAGSENSLETESLGRFAVDEHNKKENALLEFVRVVKAKEQVVAGTLHHLVVEAIDGGKKKLYEAKVWVKPWLGFKEVQEFKHAEDLEAASETPSFTASDLGVKQGGHAPGWQDVHPHDPQVQDAANHAVKSLQQRSNSLFPYELQEVVHAKAEVIEDHAKFNMLLKLKRGEKEEKYRVEVHKNNEGAYNLNQMEAQHS